MIAIIVVTYSIMIMSLCFEGAEIDASTRVTYQFRLLNCWTLDSIIKSSYTCAVRRFIPNMHKVKGFKQTQTLMR